MRSDVETPTDIQQQHIENESQHVSHVLCGFHLVSTQGIDLVLYLANKLKLRTFPVPRIVTLFNIF